MTMITGHSGFENTGGGSLKSVETAIRMGLDCVEVDVRLDPEGTPRLSHDEFKDYKSAVLLRDVFDLIARSSTCVNVDLKETRALYPVLALAEECRLKEGQLIFSGTVKGSTLAADASIIRRARVFWAHGDVLAYYFEKSGKPLSPGENVFGEDEDRGTDVYMDAIIETARSMGVAGVNLTYRTLKPETLKRICESGFPISIWTVNDEEVLRRILKLSPMNVTTMEPTLARRIAEEL